MKTLQDTLSDAMEDVLDHEDTVAVVVVVVTICEDGMIKLCSAGNDKMAATAADQLSVTIGEIMDEANELNMEMLADVSGEVMH
jgi:hypothetical protein